MAIGGASGGTGNARSIEAGAAFIRIFAKDDLSSQLKQIAGRLNTAGGFLMKSGGALMTPFLAALPLLGGAKAELADLSKMGATAKAFGLTAEAASRLFGVFKASGSDLRDATEGLVTLGQRVTDALSGSGKDAAELFDGLGVAAKEFDGLNPADQFYRLHAALQQVQNPAQRVQLLLKAVGEDTGKNLISTLSMTSDELQRLGASFEVSQLEITQATRATAAYSLAVAELGRVWDLVAVGVSPVIEHLAAAVTKLLQPVKEWLKNNRELVGILITAALAVGTVGAVVFATGVAFKVMAFSISGIAGLYGKLAAAAIFAAKTVVMSAISMWTALGGPATLAILGITAAVAALGYLFFTQTDLGREWAGAIGEYFAQTAANARAAYGGVLDALRGGDLELAWKIVTTFLTLEWERAIAEINRLARDAAKFFISGWYSGIYLVKGLLIDLEEGFTTLFTRGLKAAFRNFEAETRAALLTFAALIAPFDEKFARDLRGVAALPADQLNRAADNAERAELARLQRERNRIQKELDRRNGRLDAAFGGMNAEDAERVAQLQKELAELNLLAAQKAADAAKGWDGAGRQAAAVQAATRGVFAAISGGYLASGLGGRNGPALQQVAEQKKTNVKLDEVVAAIVGLGGLRFA